ncbi:MAG: bifunctional UDP-N-acetylglucosamine diphosphorylase/glucosamine-1-phosphate N-acetyltransferase GlmU [Pseudomonadota bacterium]
MSATTPSVVVLAAGKGTRMKSATTKVLHEIAGRSMLEHVLAAAAELSPERLCVVIGDHAPEVGEQAKAFSAGAQIAVQAPPRGTGDAVIKAVPALRGAAGAVLVLYADTPLVRSETMAALAAEVEKGAAVAVLGFRPGEPGAYGRLVVDEAGALQAIVEAKDASPDELAIPLCNSGVLAIAADALFELLPKIGNDNAKGEYYLTDIVGLARAAGRSAVVVEAETDEVLGVNSRIELAEAERIYQDRARRAAMAEGATLADPQTVYFSHDTRLGADVSVGQNVVFGPGVVVEDGAEVKPFSHLEGCVVKRGASVGPFARLRPGAQVGENAKVGNFVEIKKTDLGPGAKVSHLAYLGDAEVGAEANIGAGTITCNYDGYDKFRTVIGDGAFVGSNASLVAPVTIGAGAYIGSGSVVTKDVEADALAVARGKQVQKSGWAASFRRKKDKGGA